MDGERATPIAQIGTLLMHCPLKPQRQASFYHQNAQCKNVNCRHRQKALEEGLRAAAENKFEKQKKKTFSS